MGKAFTGSNNKDAALFIYVSNTPLPLCTETKTKSSNSFEFAH